MSLHTWRPQDSCKPSSCSTFMLNSHWGRAATGKKEKKSCIYGHRVTLLMSELLWPCKLWPVRLPCQGEGFSRQEYWSVLANTGCLTLLEHYIFCCPSRQLPWVPGAARTPATQAAAPSSCSTLTGSGLPQAKNVLHLCTQGCFGRVWLFVTMWTMVCQSSLSVGFSRQEYWSVLANTGLHTLLEHHISCCPSCQLSCLPDAVRTPAIQAAARPPYLALTGANPSLPGQPQEQTPVGNPHAEVEIKPQLKPRGRVAEEEGPKPSHQLYKLKVKSNQLADSVSVEYINGHWEFPQKKMH